MYNQILFQRVWRGLQYILIVFTLFYMVTEVQYPHGSVFQGATSMAVAAGL